MKTITVQILDDKALGLLRDMEVMNLIAIRGFDKKTEKNAREAIKSYAGLMIRQPIEEVNRQLSALRNEWDRGF